jgi:pSer/pThr/pTyr-binding forkhead associated (FHA) protein
MSQPEIPKNAFLIVNGAEIFPLTKPVVNIGRMDDNDVVIANPHISRYHAQLRATEGRYVLVDLKSTGGTSVNGEKVTQIPIYPGDVISLSGVPLIYGQSSGTGKLGPAPSVAERKITSNQPTKGITDSVDVGSIDRFLEMFDPAEGDEGKGQP